MLAGFRALVAAGPQALRVETVARTLLATKGSFYWHFGSPARWHEAMLAYWEQRAFADVAVALADLDGPQQLRALAEHATAGSHDDAHGGIEAEPALREWARADPAVAEVVGRVDAGRLAFVASAFERCGQPPEQARLSADIYYGAYIGLQTLRREAPTMAAALLTLADRLLQPDARPVVAGGPTRHVD